MKELFPQVKFPVGLLSWILIASSTIIQSEDANYDLSKNDLNGLCPLIPTFEEFDTTNDIRAVGKACYKYRWVPDPCTMEENNREESDLLHCGHYSMTRCSPETDSGKKKTSLYNGNGFDLEWDEVKDVCLQVVQIKGWKPLNKRKPRNPVYWKWTFCENGPGPELRPCGHYALSLYSTKLDGEILEESVKDEELDSLSSSPDRSNLMAVPGIEVPSMHVERSKRFIKQAERRRPGYRMTHRARRPKKKSSATPVRSEENPKPMGRAMHTSNPEDGTVPDESNAEPMGRSMLNTGYYSDENPLRNKGFSAGGIGRSFAQPRSFSSGDSTSKPNLDIGLDVATNLCALQAEFDETGSPPSSIIPDPSSKYFEKFKMKSDQGSYSFKWKTCTKGGTDESPCGWYELSKC